MKSQKKFPEFTKRGLEMTERIKLKKQKSPLKAIRLMCIKCMGGGGPQAHKELIRECASTACPLHDFRFGRNPHSKHPGNIGNFLRETPKRAGAREKFQEIVS